MEYVTQCRLQMDTAHTTAFIPSKLAVVGKSLKINGIDGWVVTDVFEKVPFSSVISSQRSSSDIWQATSGSDVVGHK